MILSASLLLGATLLIPHTKITNAETFGFYIGEINGGGGMVISMVNTNGYGGQIHLDYNLATLKARKCYNGTFGTWKDIVNL